MIIEIFGLPGAGKTTVYNSLKSTNSEESNLIGSSEFSEYRRNIDRLETIKLFSQDLSGTIKYLMFLKKINAIKNKSELKRALKNKIIPFQLSNFFDKNKDKALIFDQLYIQNVWSILFNAKYNDYSVIDTLLKFDIHLRTKKYIYINVDLHEAVDRIANRGKGNSRFDGNDKGKIISELKNKNKIFDYIYHFLINEGVEVQKYNSTNGSNFIAKKIAEKYLEL